jgi:hypothetical protein
MQKNSIVVVTKILLLANLHLVFVCLALKPGPITVSAKAEVTGVTAGQNCLFIFI